MTDVLTKVKAAKDVSGVANLIGYKPKKLSSLLYKIPDRKKYTAFDIGKKNGGVRTINAPIPELKLAQRRLHEVLSACLAEVEVLEKVSPLCTLSHGFSKNRSIYSNAKRHKGRRWVLNLDLKDFFPSINFGRVRGLSNEEPSFSVRSEGCNGDSSDSLS